MRLIERLKTEGEFYIKIIELMVLVGGVYFGVTGIRENTDSNLTASRSQLYESEDLIAGREYDASASSLLSLYAQPDAAVTDPREYIRQRMAAIADDPALLQSRNVTELYEAFNGLGTFGRTPPSPGIVAARQAFNHLSAIFSVMHSAEDYRREGVMSDRELSGWLAYVNDIGPHPLLLITLANWHDAGYMSRAFARTVRQMLLDASPRNRQIIEYFYPQMLAPGFLETLTDY